MTFTKIEQDGKTLRVNSNHVVLVAPIALVGQTQLVLINGMALNIKGTVDEISDRLDGKSTLEL